MYRLLHAFECNSNIISRGEAECNLAIPSEIIAELHEKACNYLLIIFLIKCLSIFQDSYMRKGDMTTFQGLLFRPP